MGMEARDFSRVRLHRAQKGRKILEDMKSVLYGVMEYAYLHEYIPIERLQCIKYINFNRQAEEKKNPHVPFTEEEIRLVWSCKGEYIPDLMLMLLYTNVYPLSRTFSFLFGHLVLLKSQDSYNEFCRILTFVQ